VTDPKTEFLYLTTRGRRSGQPREIEIWFTERDGCYYIIAEHGDSAHWVRNLRAHPSVTVRVAERTFPALARVVDGTAEPRLRDAVRDLSRTKYGWGDGLVVELAPILQDPMGARNPGIMPTCPSA
jgi:deazaflavin-dependent oxidoreductase (nitroreductase family)